MSNSTTTTTYTDQFDVKCHSATCRSCRQTGLLPVLDLGDMPLSDRLLTEAQLQLEEPRFPLEMAYCPGCSLVQILHTTPPEVLFCQDYPYYSSFSDALLQHSRDNAMDLIARAGLTSDSLVVELASNDGYMLRNFVEKGVRVLGIDPADGPAAEAEKIGVPTMRAFFTYELARQLREQGAVADVMIANNVLAHVADTNGFVEGIAILLSEDGVGVIEVPYVRDLIDHCEFDTIYHEHLCYFSVTSLQALFRRHGLFINDVKRLSIHGGSLRLYVQRRENVGKAVRLLLGEEKAQHIDSYAYYQNFAERVTDIGRQMFDLLTQLKTQGHSVAAYGAAAKGAILLNYIGVGAEMIDFVVDRNVHKQGRFMPGVHVPIVEPSRLVTDRPDYVVILPWNFKEEILSQQEPYRQLGGKFIVPIPAPHVV